MKRLVDVDLGRSGLVAHTSSVLRCVWIEEESFVAHVTDEIECLIRSTTDHSDVAGNFEAALQAFDVNWVDVGQTEPQRYDEQ